MANKIMGVILILFGAVLGFGFSAQVFRNGFHEGLSRLPDLKYEQIVWAVGAIFALIVGISALLKKTK